MHFQHFQKPVPVI